MLTYKEKLETCSGCEWNDSPEHKLYHDTGLSSGIIKELNLNSIDEIKKAFSDSIPQSKCYILLNGRRTKIRVENEYIFPKKLIDLIPNIIR